MITLNAHILYMLSDQHIPSTYLHAYPPSVSVSAIYSSSAAELRGRTSVASFHAGMRSKLDCSQMVSIYAPTV